MNIDKILVKISAQGENGIEDFGFEFILNFYNFKYEIVILNSNTNYSIALAICRENSI